MFSAPDLFVTVPDIDAIYHLNDIQIARLEQELEGMDDNLSLDQMQEDIIHRWEEMLHLSYREDDSIEDRRFRVKSKVVEKLPYTYRVLCRKLDALCPEGYSMELNNNLDYAKVKIALKSKRMRDDVESLMEETLPLNILFDVIIMFNSYQMLSVFTYEELSSMKYIELREEVLE